MTTLVGVALRGWPGHIRDLSNLGVSSDHIQGVIPPKNLPKIGPNRHFTAKGTKRQDGHISVCDEHIRVNFDRHIDYTGQ